MDNRGAMAAAELSQTTQLLKAWAQGDQAALQQLTPRVYDELRRIAGHFMQNERQGRTLQATALVHEAFLRLIDVTNVDWQHRAHFFLQDIPDVRSARARELIALDEALNALDEIDARKARVIELRFFGGLSVEETAEVLKVSPDTVMRDWRLARAWLLAEMSRRS